MRINEDQAKKKSLGVTGSILLKLSIFCVIIMSMVACGNQKESKKAEMNIDYVTTEDGSERMQKTGTEKRSFQVEDGNPVEVDVKVKKESGTLNMYIAPDGDKEKAIYTGNKLDTSEFSVTAGENGNYIIWIEADEYIGDYTFAFTKYSRDE